MEYLKNLFIERELISIGGRSYLPLSLEVLKFRDFDVAADVKIQFLTMQLGKEVILGFNGDPYIVSQTIQDLRED